MAAGDVDSNLLGGLRRWKGDKVLAITVGLLLCFGLIMIYSASALEADERYGNALHFTMRQGAGVVAGLTCIVVLQIVSMQRLRHYSWWMFGLGIVGLLLVFTPLGYTAYAASRWIRLGGINVQPSEFAKIALILVLAHYLANNEGRLGDLTGVAFLAKIYFYFIAEFYCPVFWIEKNDFKFFNIHMVSDGMSRSIIGIKKQAAPLRQAAGNRETITISQP